MEQNKELPENELPVQILESIGRESVSVTKEKAAGRVYAYQMGFEDGYFLGATAYAIWKIRCEKALEYINAMQNSGVIELNNQVVNEIKSFLDEK